MDEITAEWTVEELAPAGEPPPARPGVLLPLVFAAKTDLGRVRENNEDKFEWWEPTDPALLASRGRLYAVADGMGGHAAGQIASEMALKALGAYYYAGTRGTPEDALRRAIIQANAMVFDTQRAVPSRNGMGCTVVAVAVVDDEAVVAWAGDSRVYRIRDGAAEQLTEDHSWVVEQVQLGILTQEQAEQSKYRNVITRCLGPQAEVNPDVRREALRAGDALLLCTDGLTGVVTDEEIAAIAAAAPPSFACRDLIERANERGGPDNVTAAILQVVGDTESAPDPAAVPASEIVESQETPRKWRGLFNRG